MKSFEIAGLPPDEVKPLLSAGSIPIPFEVLGPHRGRGRFGDPCSSGLMRAGLTSCWINIREEPGRSAEKFNRNGFFLRDRPERNAGSSVPNPGYRLGRIALPDTRSLSVRADHGRGRPASLRRRTALEDLRQVWSAMCAPSAMLQAFISQYGRLTLNGSAWFGDFNGWDGRVNPMRKLIG